MTVLKRQEFHFTSYLEFYTAFTQRLGLFYCFFKEETYLHETEAAQVTLLLAHPAFHI